MNLQSIPLSKSSPAELALAAKFAGLDEDPRFQFLLEPTVQSHLLKCCLDRTETIQELNRMGYDLIQVDQDNRLYSLKGAFVAFEIALPIKSGEA